MTRDHLDRDRRNVMELVANGTMTAEEAELVLTGIILERMQSGLLTSAEASMQLKKIK